MITAVLILPDIDTSTYIGQGLVVSVPWGRALASVDPRVREWNLVLHHKDPRRRVACFGTDGLERGLWRRRTRCIIEMQAR